MKSASVNPSYFDALNLSENLRPTPKNIERVAASASIDAARWAFSQWELRKRASAKFTRADQMLFDRDGLEMATHETVAEYHAGLFPKGELVVDLTSGIGADLVALGQRGPARGLEIDPDRAELARHNLRVYGVEADVVCASAEDESAPNYWFADPARRTGSGRLMDPEQFLPNPRKLVDRFGHGKLGIIKLSPMLPDPFLESLGHRIEFVSFDRECREALVFVGSDVVAGTFCVHVESGQKLEASNERVDSVGEPAEFLIEVDPAAIRAHAIARLAKLHGLQLLGRSNGYLTGPEAISSPWLTAYRVLGGNRGDFAETLKLLESLDSASPTWKQRGADLDLQKMAKRSRMRGQRPLCVFAYRVGKSLRFTIAERVEPASANASML